MLNADQKRTERLEIAAVLAITIAYEYVRNEHLCKHYLKRCAVFED